MLISYAVTAQLICFFVFAYADCWFSHPGAHIITFIIVNISEEAGGIAADQIAGAVGGAFVVILWGIIVIILICFIYR